MRVGLRYIRWDELQNEGTFVRSLAFWSIVCTVGLLLGIGSTSFLSALILVF